MWKLLLPLVLVAMLLVGVGLMEPASPRADVVVINRGDCNTLDLQQMSWLQDYRVAAALYEGLLNSDRFSAEFSSVPGVAESWSISEDGLVYTFKLRGDAKWSNGKPVTAEDFRYSWRRALLPDLKNDYATLFRLIQGAGEFYRWRAEELKKFEAESAGAARPVEARKLWAETVRRFDETVGVRAPDARTLVVTLERPVAYFLELMAFESFFPVYGPVVERYEQPSAVTGRLEFSSQWTRPPLLVSNGKFKLEGWRFKRDMLLVRNEHYWNQADIHADSILMPSVSDPNAQVMAFQTRTVDWLTDMVPDYRAEMLAEKEAFYREHWDEYQKLKSQGLDPVAIDRRLPPDPRKRVHSFPTFGTYWYNFNCLPALPDGRTNPLADARVRRALSMVIDKRNMVENIRRSGETVAGSIVPPGSIRGYTPPKGLEYDVEGGRKLLAEAGFPGGKGLPEIEVLFNRDGGHDLIAQAMKRDWEMNLGVTVRLVQKEIKVLRNDLKNHNFMVSRGSWFGDYGDPTTFLDVNRSDDNNNDRGYVSAEFDELMKRSDAERDPARRMALLREAEAIVVERDMPLVPLFYFSSTMLFDPDKLSGVSPHARQKQDIGLLGVIGQKTAGGRGPFAPREVPVVPAGGGAR
jgi:oligopeptide transport system substrate-binding protein